MKALTLLALLLVSGSASMAAATAEKYKVGDTFAPFTTKDQHGATYTYDGTARLVIVAFEMGEGKAANAYFEKQPADFLPSRHALFISNIHGMPGIGRAFALPKMKKYPHRILLADSADFLARHPSQTDRLTVLALDERGVITDIRFVDPKKEMPTIFAPGK